MSLSTYFNDCGELIELDRGDVVFRQGENSDFIYSIRTGLLKAFYITADGKERIKSFVREDDVFGNLSALLSKRGCSFTLVCLEPTSLMRIRFSKFQKLAKTDLVVANQLVRLLANLAIKKERREYEFLCLSAKERYGLLADTTPELLDRVTQNDIARYLGITPVALSRIRSRMRGPN